VGIFVMGRIKYFWALSTLLQGARRMSGGLQISIKHSLKLPLISQLTETPTVCGSLSFVLVLIFSNVFTGSPGISCAIPSTLFWKIQLLRSVLEIQLLVTLRKDTFDNSYSVFKILGMTYWNLNYP
jgi:hypothetical protein